jgi:hypothetical protein
MPPRTSPSRSATNGRRRGPRPRGSASAIVDKVTQLVAVNQTLQLKNNELAEENRRLTIELRDIGRALGRLTGVAGPRGRPGRRRAEPLLLEEAKPLRQRKAITDPAVLEKRRQALAKARAARAEKIAAAKVAGNESVAEGQ